MAFKKILLTIDTMIRNPVPIEGINQEDNVELNIVVTENKTPKDLSSQTIKVYVRRIDGTLVEQTNQITLTNARKGEVTVKLKNSAFNKEGYALFQLDVSDSIGRMTSSYATFKIGKGLVSAEAIANTNEVEALKKIEEYIKKANLEFPKYENKINEFNQKTEEYKNEVVEYQGEVKKFQNIANSLQTQFDEAVANITNGVESATNSEIVQARGGEVNLNRRLDKFDSQLEHIQNYNSINVVTQLGLDNNGVDEIGVKLQNFIDNHNGTRLNLYFPNGIYLWNVTVSTNKTLFINGEKSNVVINNTGNLACLKHGGSCTINGLIFSTSGSDRTEFTVYSKDGSEFFCYDTVFSCNRGKINGLHIENTIISIIDRCKFNHSQISLKTWDCKITNTWVWALWRDYGIGIHGGSGNITITNVDIVPPFRTDSGVKNGSVIVGQKAGIWINSIGGTPTNNVIMENIYFDGNPVLDTGVGLLCENVFGITLSSYRANKLNSNVIVIDGSYNVIISKGMHYENNKYDQQAYEVLFRNTLGTTFQDVVIDNCHFINHKSTGITVPTSAIKVDSSVDGRVIITNNRVCQQGSGYAYGSLEIDIASIIPKLLYTNKGTKTVYRASGSLTYSGTGATLTTTLPLAYTPKQRDYSFSLENGFTPNIRVQQINNYQAWIATSESVTSTTLYYDIMLGK